MRKAALLLAGIGLFFTSFAITKPNERPPVKADQIYLPIGKNGEQISLMDLSTIKVKELEKFTGKKMRFVDKVGFKISQRKLRLSINDDGTFNNKKMKKALESDGTTGFHGGGFALGFLVGLLGVIIAYFINDDKKRNRVKWAWLGLLASFVLSILLILVILA